MAIEIISTLKPKNNGTFPIAEAKDITVDEKGTRLDDKLTELANNSGGSGGGDGGRTLKALEFTSLESLYDGAITLEDPIFYDIGLNGDEYIPLGLPNAAGGVDNTPIDATRFQVKLVYEGSLIAAQAVIAKGIVTLMFGRMEGEFVSMAILTSFDGTEQEGTIGVENVTKFNLYYF